MRPRIQSFALLLFLIVTSALSAQAPDYTREVRPILARYCFKCHGPDEKTRKAKFEQHWAYVAPKPMLPPDVKNRKWPHNPIDAFVLSRLEKEGLRPSPPADPHTLLRRVSLDLIGLPPTVAEVDEFVNAWNAPN